MRNRARGYAKPLRLCLCEYRFRPISFHSIDLLRPVGQARLYLLVLRRFRGPTTTPNRFRRLLPSRHRRSNP